MKKIWVVFQLFALLAAPATFAADRAEELLSQMAAHFRAMKGYEVSFVVTAGEHTTAGRYAVEGESYYLTLGDAEVFCDGKVRYEVDKRRREVTVNPVDPTSRNLLNNPVHAFDFIGDEYSSFLISERNGEASIRLTPTVKNASAGSTITVTLSTTTKNPLSVVYDYDGEQVSIAVRSVVMLRTPLHRFVRNDFEGFEFIDFR